MDRDVANRAESDDAILNIDIPDDTLERLGGHVEGQAVTWAYCTHVWYNCGWPQ
jgi:hypothetical protein